MRLSMLVIFGLWCVSALALAAEASWVELEGVVYGARPDERGPIGGGPGYKDLLKTGDHVAKDLESLCEALGKAKAGEVVFLPGDAVIDLTTLVYIDQLVLKIPGGVTLASDRGRDGSAGALICSDALNTRTLIEVTGAEARMTGLRLEGPNPKRYLDHHRRAFGPGGDGHKYYYKFPTQDGVRTKFADLEVDNCEISGFGHAGICLQEGVGHEIHHNYIHHCQYNGLGYGVSHGTASSIIEYNQFDWNRHSIAGTGRPGCTYVARHNIELGTSLSHCFDMHGGRDREDGTNIAGTTIEIYNNTFGAPQTPIRIRGVPQEICDVHHNWFLTHQTAAKAVSAEAKTRVENNAYGPNPKAAR